MTELLIGGGLALVVGVFFYAVGHEKLGTAFIVVGAIATGVVFLFLVLAVLVLMTNHDRYLE